jgi:hypothetical protein
MGILGCARATKPPQPYPTPGSVEPRNETISHTAPPGGWSFRYGTGSSNYRVTRVAAIEAQSDSGIGREVATNTTYEVITLGTPATDTLVFNIVADSFATTTQGRIGSVQPVQLPITVSGRFTGSGIEINGETRSDKCEPVASSLASDLRNLLPQLPAQMRPGMSWADSVQTTGCQAGIPTIINLRRVFLVSGQTTQGNEPLLVILRTDTITSRGEGSQLQHRVALQAEGTGRATYHIDFRTGKVIQLNAVQDLTLTFTGSARTTRLRETSQQEFVLLR